MQAIDELKAKSGLPLYIFAFLRNYGNLNSIDVAWRDLSYVYSSSFGEYAFALLGYFYGYKNLRDTDGRLGSSEIASAFVKGKAAVKFQLRTRFDYTVIEFVFKTGCRQVKDSLKIRENIEDEKLSGISDIKKNPVYEKIAIW
ncbi:hypothetical protein OKW96_11800 [Sphingobacterium sp. KU25419]|nr:hypothetical protein OKW96_11800 [Sphingobacterium sp. KU25419]